MVWDEILDVVEIVSWFPCGNVWQFEGIALFGLPLFIWYFGALEVLFPVFPEELFGFFRYVQMGEEVWVCHGFVKVFE